MKEMSEIEPTEYIVSIFTKHMTNRLNEREKKVKYSSTPC